VPEPPDPERRHTSDDGDELIARLLALMGDELGVEVSLEVPHGGGHAELAPTPTGLAIPAVGQDGVAYGVLQVLPDTGRGPAPQQVRPLGEVVARVVGERLERAARRQADHEQQVAEVRALLTGRAMVMRYQPILSLPDGAIVGVEALATFPGRTERSPDRWFSDADAVGLGVTLEVAAVTLALRVLTRLPSALFLSLNVSPATACSAALRRALRGRALDRLVFEITEHAEVTDYPELNAALAPLRQAGLRLAVDDAGAGFASLRHILRMAPDIIKLDRTLVAGIDRDPVLRALTYSIASFASATQAKVIAEGIERAAELNALRFLGIECGQGYYLCPPGALSDVLSSTAPAPDPVSRSSAG
jgi:EAL domain-containing protein (putative c-di-GMP-specific phosphodiesterase class I)